MCLVPLGGNELAVYSPTWVGERTWERVDALGRVRVIVAPNHFHHVWLARFREHYPDAIAVASERAMPRLTRRGHCGLVTPAEACGALPDDVALVGCHATKSGELWLVVKRGDETTWVVGDAFFNADGPFSGAFAVFARLTKTGPGLSVGNTFRWLALEDERAYRRWLLERLTNEPPSRVAFCHGRQIERDVAARMRTLAEVRLRA